MWCYIVTKGLLIINMEKSFFAFFLNFWVCNPLINRRGHGFPTSEFSTFPEENTDDYQPLNEYPVHFSLPTI